MIDIADGTYGRTRSGEKVGPVTRCRCDAWTDKAGFYYLTPERSGGYYSHGRILDDGSESPFDLIAEWTDGPVRTVTRREVVAGSYGDVEVGGEVTDHPKGRVCLVGIGPKSGTVALTIAELKAAAAVLLELAGALGE